MVKSVKVVVAAAAVVAVSGVVKYGYSHKDEIKLKLKDGSKQAKKTISDHLDKIKAEAKKKMKDSMECQEDPDTQEISEDQIEETADEMLEELDEQFSKEKENIEE